MGPMITMLFLFTVNAFSGPAVGPLRRAFQHMAGAFADEQCQPFVGTTRATKRGACLLPYEMFLNQVFFYFLKARTCAMSALTSSSLKSVNAFILVLSSSLTPSLMALAILSSFMSACTLESV